VMPRVSKARNTFSNMEAAGEGLEFI